MRLPRAVVQRSRRGLKVRRQGLDQVGLGADLLLRVRDAESLVQNRIELHFAPPPVIVVLAVLTPHEEPSIVDLTAGSYDRDAGALGHPNSSLFVVREHMPLVHRKFRKPDAHPPGGSWIGGIRPHLVA